MKMFILGLTLLASIPSFAEFYCTEDDALKHTSGKSFDVAKSHYYCSGRLENFVN